MGIAAFSRAADQVILSSGWRRRLIAFVAGACGALALSPFDFFPAMFVPLTVAVWLIDGIAHHDERSGLRAALIEARDAAGDGWWFGFGYFAAGLWWLGAAMLVDADQYAWAVPFASLGLPAALAIFPAAGFAVARLLWSPGASRLLALAVGLGGLEWLRGHVATGFPWNEFGMALGGNLTLAQGASLVGLYGLNFIAIVVFASPALLRDASKPEGRGARRALVGSALVFVGLAGFGMARLAQGKVENVVGARLRVMQPNLQQDAWFRPEHQDEILDKYLAISDRATSPQTTGVADATHVIWPESSFPFILARQASALSRIRAFLGPKTILVTGAARMEPRGASLRTAAFFNSMLTIDQEHGIFGSYDKSHLVPFGEYLPFGAVLERFGLRQLVHIPGGFEPGARRAPLAVPGLPLIAALVCYEAVFPGEVVTPGPDGERPGAMINVSNDGWYLGTPGPYQHLAQARLRAVEEGLPLIRAANTGISAFIDPYGRVISALPVGVEGVLDGNLPKPLPATPFARYPLVGPGVLLALAMAGALLGRWKTARAGAALRAGLLQGAKNSRNTRI